MFTPASGAIGNLTYGRIRMTDGSLFEGGVPVLCHRPAAREDLASVGREDAADDNQYEAYPACNSPYKQTLRVFMLNFAMTALHGSPYTVLRKDKSTFPTRIWSGHIQRRKPMALYHVYSKHDELNYCIVSQNFNG